MSLTDIIFGKKRIISHPILGQLKSERIRGNNQTKVYCWFGSITLNNKPEKTFIIMEGNNLKPFSSHLNFVSQLIEKWESEYLLKIENKLYEKGISKIEKYSNWKNDYYIGSINPTDSKKAEFELTLEPLDSKNTDFIRIEFKNNNITKIETY